MNSELSANEPSHRRLELRFRNLPWVLSNAAGTIGIAVFIELMFLAALPIASRPEAIIATAVIATAAIAPPWLRSYVEIADGLLTVQNPYRRLVLPLSSIVEVRSGFLGSVTCQPTLYVIYRDGTRLSRRKLAAISHTAEADLRNAIRAQANAD